MNRIHPTAVIDATVKMGDNNTVGPYAVLLGNIVIGNGNWIGAHASLGAPGERRGEPHPATWAGDSDAGSLVLGNNNTIRDSAVIHSGAVRGTHIGNNCYIMNTSYIAHDCHLENGVTISGAMVGGTSTIGHGANLGLNVSVHQGTVIGAGAMVGMGAVITHHVAPYAKVFGNPAKAHGANSFGMQRSGFSAEVIGQLSRALETGALSTLAELCPDDYERFLAACSASSRRA